ncbi:MAG: hypothetical protein E7379_01500 [Clostridiales bacterium]|nr:hypothetical protein [Clostridiales bacterium]
MKVEKILEYQKLDREMYKLEREIKDNPNKEKANKLHETMRVAQEKSVALEGKAGAILKEIDKVKGHLKLQQDKMAEFTAKDLSTLSKQEIEKIASLKDKLAQNLQILEKNLTALAENVNSVLSEFNKTIKTFNTAKEDFAKCKTSYDNDIKAIESKKAEVAKNLSVIAKEIDSVIMEAYQKRRKENIFPVVVQLMEQGKGSYFCGGCRTQLSIASINKLDSEAVVSCDHCRRLIYKHK